MKFWYYFFLVLVILLASGTFISFLAFGGIYREPSEDYPSFVINTVVKENEKISDKYTCKGEGLNPGISFDDFPKETQTFAVIIYEASKEKRVLWTAYNIHSSIPIEEGRIPRGSVLGKNDQGDYHYDPPCPKRLEKTYRIVVYALDSFLTLSGEYKEEHLHDAMRGSIVAKSVLEFKA